ncbi:hypothetical protein [Lacrimispora sp.]|jgi:hypothetical protein|uniref:hypothetical protein n=1 Tax=Lacrimispora sp. TaxID=2719234 RepID=UPI0029DFDB05|nr:hypothetical protein [Lacrimispora sp.]
MKKKIILFAAAMLISCLIAGCQVEKKADKFHRELENISKINSKDDKDTGSDNKVGNLDENRIISDQSFQTELDDWRDVRFVSYSPKEDSDFEDVSFYLMKDNKVVYSFPYYGENNKTDQYAGLFDSVESVAFQDVNGDNLRDVIVIINYITGAGPQGMEPRPKVRIFLADKKDFILAKEMTDDVNDHVEEKDMSMDHILEYLKNK